MRRLWLIFSQAATVGMALLFVVATLKPQWLSGQGQPFGAVVAEVVSLRTAAPAASAPATGAINLAEAARRGLTVPDLTEPTIEDTLHAARWLQDRGLVGCAAG